MIKQLAKKYWHIVFALYLPIYLVWFFTLEGITYKYHTIHCFIDDYIPHVKYFIVPYMLWFPFMAACLIFFFIYSRKEFIQYATALIVGMSICLAIYSIYPSDVDIRPADFSGNDIFSKILMFIYSMDTSTNVCPSIHCLNSFLSCIAVLKCAFFKNKPVIKTIVLVLTTLIILSTFFLKQHSVADCFWAMILTAIIYVAVYILPAKYLSNKQKKPDSAA